jgi:hypothetical protein
MVIKAQRQVPRGLLIGADDVFDAAQSVVLRGRGVVVGIGARGDTYSLVGQADRTLYSCKNSGFST